MAHALFHVQHSLSVRLCFVLGILGLVFLVPWWLVLAISCIGIALFYPFPEFLLPGILFDILYGAGPAMWDMFRHTILFLTIFIVFTFIRSRIRI